MDGMRARQASRGGGDDGDDAPHRADLGGEEDEFYSSAKRAGTEKKKARKDAYL